MIDALIFRMNIQLPAGKAQSFTAIFTSLLAFLLLLASLPQQTKALPFPFYAHQFQLTCNPKVTASNSPKTFSVSLPASYNTSYTRYLALSGYNAQLKDKMSFRVFLSTRSNTAQTVVLTADSSINMVMLSIYIIFIMPNNWIWATNNTFTCSVINKYGGFSAAKSELTYISVPTTVTNAADFKIYPYVSWYRGQATQIFFNIGPPIPLILSAKLQSSIPPSLEVSFNRDGGTNQIFVDIGYVIVMVNQTQLLFENYPYYFNNLGSNAPFNTFPNLNINAIFVSSTFGGLNGNCLIGPATLKVSGNFNFKVNRGPTFSATYPISNVVNGVQGWDGYFAMYNIICFTGTTCSANLFFNPTNFLCVPCGITNCTTCLTYAICKVCAIQNALNGSACVYCPLLSPGCLTCANSTYCMSCIDDHYALNQSRCLTCATFIPGCDTCDNATSCTACLAVGFYTNITACVPCSTALLHCLICTNDTVCIDCENDRYYDSSGPACVLCNTTLANCNRCEDNTICLGCQVGYFLASNNTCVECNYSLSHCLICSNNVTCTSCETGYYVSGAVCQICSSAPTLANCSECSSSTVCTLCDVTYYLNPSNTCSPCSTLTNCLLCTDGSTCVQCATNYLLSGTVCLPCLSVLSNCLTCDNSTYCTGCISDTYFLSSTLAICLPCSIGIIDCDRCSVANNELTNFSMTCLSCFSPMIVNSNNVCQNCADLIPNCETCLNYSFCQNCVNNSFVYFVSNNTCTPCPDLFRNCSECTMDLCTKCQEGFSLSPNFLACNCLVGTYTNGVCSTIVGCVQPFLYPSKQEGCHKCESVNFFVTPVYDYCQCRRGTLVGNLCTDITNCISALIGPDGNIMCAFCNTTAGFKSLPQNKVNCVCKDHYESNGTYCLEICGDGFLMNTSKPNCDDGNNQDGDGCSSGCLVQKYFRCQNGSSQAPSQCFYIGSKAKVSLSQIYKTQELNQGIFQFQISPAIKALSKMDFSKYLSLNCNSNYVISQTSYFDGILTVKADYTQNMQGVQCSFLLDFDRNIVRSPSVKLSFNAISETYPLIVSNYLSQLKTFKLSFTTLSYVIMGVFGLSLTHKMIGAELIVCTQIVYLSNSFYQTPSIYLSPLQNLNLVTGNWSYFHKNQTQRMFPPFSRRIKMSVYFLQNTVFIISALIVIFTLMLILVIYLKIKFQQPDIPQMHSKQEMAIAMNSSKIFKITKVIYRSFAFPAVASFLMVIVISGYIHNHNFGASSDGQFSLKLNAVSQCFAWVALSLILGFEIVGSLFTENQHISAFVGEQYAKKWYINLFITKVFILSIIIQLGISFTYSKLLFALGSVQLIYLLVTILFRVYLKAIDNIGVILCVMTECASLVLPLVYRFYTIPEYTTVMMVYAMIGLLIFSVLFATIRTFIVLKNIIIRCRSPFGRKSSKIKQRKQMTEQLMAKDQTFKKIKKLVARNQIDEIEQINNVLLDGSRKKLALDKQQVLGINQKIQNTSIYQNMRENSQIKKGVEDIQLKNTLKRLKRAFRHKILREIKGISQKSQQ